jgi:hypothetical protein
VGVELDGGVRFGNLSRDEASVANVPIRGHRYSVQCASKGMVVLEDGAKLLATDCPAILRGFEKRGRTIRFDLYADAPGVRITFFGLKPGAEHTIELSGSRFTASSSSTGTLRVDYGEAQPARP